jgi:CRP-like cAMP-binding protein
MNLPVNPYYLAEADLLELVEKIEAQGEADWQLFLSYAEQLEIAPGDVVIRQMDVDRVVYVLTRGELEVVAAKGAGGPKKTIATISPVAIIGEQTFLDSEPRTATVLAKTEATVHRLTLSDFDRLRAEEPEIASAFLFDVARSLSLRARPLQAKQLGA